MADYEHRHDAPTQPLRLFLTLPLYAPLLFPNTASDARDHAANERTFLSYLRLSVYMAIVAVAIFVNFHLKNQPTPLEERISHPLGIIFLLLAMACLAAGFANYVKTVAKYARKAALVQSGVKTQIVLGVVSCAIVAACGVFLASASQQARMKAGPTNKMVPSVVSLQLGAGPHLSAKGHETNTQHEILRLLAEVAGGGFS